MWRRLDCLGRFSVLAPLGPALALATACRPAAMPDACVRGDELVRGACVSHATAARYCGPAASWDARAGKCAEISCREPTQRLDLLTGECLGARALRAIGARQHVTVGEGHALGCKRGLALRIEGSTASCGDARGGTEAADARARRCGRGALWDGQACRRVVAGGTVDVAAWSRAALGPSGSSDPAFCARATRGLAELGVLAVGSGATYELVAEVALVVPDNDISATYARVTPVGVWPLPPQAERAVAAGVDAELDLFRALGGMAELGSYVHRIDCVLHTGASPVAVPPLPPFESVQDAEDEKR